MVLGGISHWFNPYTTRLHVSIEIAGKLQPVVKDCTEDGFKLATRVNEVKNLFLFRQEEDGNYVANVRCWDGTVPQITKISKPYLYGNKDRERFSPDTNPDFDDLIARGDWPACTCTQDAIYCGYNLKYQCPKQETEEKVGFTPTKPQQYAVIPTQDNYAYLPLTIVIASALIIALIVFMIVILKKK